MIAKGATWTPGCVIRCRPHSGSGQRLYTRPVSLTQAPNGHLIGSPKFTSTARTWQRAMRSILPGFAESGKEQNVPRPPARLGESKRQTVSLRRLTRSPGAIGGVFQSGDEHGCEKTPQYCGVRGVCGAKVGSDHHPRIPCSTTVRLSPRPARRGENEGQQDRCAERIMEHTKHPLRQVVEEKPVHQAPDERPGLPLFAA